MRLNHEAVNQTAKELLLAKASNLRTPKSCVDAIANMTTAEVVAFCLYLVSHTPSTHQSCAYMTSLTHYLVDWVPLDLNSIPANEEE